MPVRLVPAAPVIGLVSMFSMSDSELEVFRLLMRKPMTVKQLQKESRMSERMLRTHLDDLTERKFVGKKVDDGKRLKYVYFANPPDMIIGMAQDVILKVERKRKEARRDIVRGSDEHTAWVTKR